jgi:hypothetical protein
MLLRNFSGGCKEQRVSPLSVLKRAAICKMQEAFRAEKQLGRSKMAAGRAVRAAKSEIELKSRRIFA